MGGWRRGMSPTEAAVAAGTRRKTKALVVPLAGLGAALFLPPLLAGLPLAGQRALIVTLITILLWTGGDPGARCRGAPERDPARAERRHDEPPRRAAGLRQPRALLPDRCADDGRRGRTQRPRRAAGQDDPRARAGEQPGGVPPAGPVLPRHDLPAAVGDDPLGDPHPYLR